MENEARLHAAINLQKKMQELGLQIVESDPWVPIKIKGVEYKLEFSYGAVKEIFRATGKVINLSQISTMDLADDDFFLAMMEAGLRTHHPLLLKEDAAWLLNSLTPKHRTYYVTCIQLAIQATEPDREQMAKLISEAKAVASEGENGIHPLAQGSTSSASGPNVEILDAPKLN